VVCGLSFVRQSFIRSLTGPLKDWPSPQSLTPSHARRFALTHSLAQVGRLWLSQNFVCFASNLKLTGEDIKVCVSVGVGVCVCVCVCELVCVCVCVCVCEGV